jgi:hypothetical protein
MSALHRHRDIRGPHRGYTPGHSGPITNMLNRGVRDSEHLDHLEARSALTHPIANHLHAEVQGDHPARPLDHLDQSDHLGPPREQIRALGVSRWGAVTVPE